MRLTIRRLVIVLAAAIIGCVCTAGTAWAQPLAPARGVTGNPPATGNPPSTGNPPGTGSGYEASVGSSIYVTGNVVPGNVYNTSYVPAQCWLEPRFTNTQSYTPGDPHGTSNYNFDADTYWWSFAANETSLLETLFHIPGSRQQIDQVFQGYQTAGKAGWWWVPAWLNGPAGIACARSLVDSQNLNNGFLDFAPAQIGAVNVPGQTLNGQLLSRIARAALLLPTITVHTNPSAPVHPSEVNLPLWVWVSYRGAASPTDTAWAKLPGGGTIWATVKTSAPVVTISVSGGAGQARIYDTCGATGSVYTGDAAAVPACGVDFLAPSISGPYTVTVTARWTVTWVTSTGGAGTFTSPPWPPSVATASVPVTVREVQSINTGG